MKKILLAATAVMFGASSFAQVANSFLNQGVFAPRTLRTDTEGVRTIGSNSASRVSDYNDTIWFDSFENPSVWTINNQTTSSGWEISNSVGTWYFPASMAINSTTGGNYAVMVPDNPNNAVATSNYITTANAIDISTYTNQNLVLSYEKFGARFLDSLKVEVSTDNSTWLTLDKNADFPILTTAGGGFTANPASRDLFIPVSIVNNDSLYIRFFWDANTSQAGIGYGWFVDDILLLDVPENDLVIDQTAFFETPRILYEWYYGTMPEQQAAADAITFSSTFYNRGKVDQTNTRLELNVSGQDNQNFVSNYTTATAGLLGDTLRTSTVYAPNNGVGTYTITWNILSDSADATPSNNMYSVDLNVSEYDYSMAPLPVSSANVVGKGGTGTSDYAITQNYYMNAVDTIIGMGVAFDSEWSKEGAAFQLSIVDSNENTVAVSDFLEATSAMITDDLIYFPLPETELPIGGYDARIDVFSTAPDSLFLVTCQDPIPPIEPATTGFFSRTTLTFGGSNYIEDMVYLTIVTKPESVSCNSNASVSGIVDDQNATGSISVTSVNGLQSNSVYSYSWTGPNGYSSASQDIANLNAQGTYTVTATDVFGCTAVTSFNVAGTVSTGDVPSLEESLSVFPNPSNGDFSLRFNNLDGVYTVNVYSTIGQLVDSRKVNVNGGSQVEEFNTVNLTQGIYFVNVKGSDDNETTLRVVVK